ncbi:MAG: hypothetical protein ACTSQJ_11285 [Promethearchaeota archaeon]
MFIYIVNNIINKNNICERRISKVASEDTLFLVDISRSMYRADILGKSRIYWALLSIKDIIDKKKKIDPNDRYSIILFSDRSYVSDDYYWKFEDLYNFIYENAELVGKTQLPIDQAVKSIIKEKRKIGQKIFRIIIVSDGFIHPSVSNPIKYAKIAKDLGIICDAIRYGKGTLSGNILKRVTEITGGNYYYVNDEDEYFEVIEKVSEKKKIRVATIFDDHKDDELDTLSKDIASLLLKIEDLTDEQKNTINFEELKCAICHSEQCLTCETGFYGCGRFCPNCLKPIHLHCALKWAEQQKGNSENNSDYKVLRCPFCYYLLKIHIMVSPEEVKISNTNKDNIIRKIRFSDDASELMTSLCGHPECGIMFDETSDTFVYKCETCGSYFHADCILKEIAETGKCPCCKCESTCLD